ncbi:hypothetical protein BegalDRAFT_2114 [Beggiatoa alba B18LD]|uniref:Uncharacterized protein n=1 Tax=Beggiatoa alba B18LD TaxID=395493 RepID=I3CH86_9GAMM|nr:hypothetical protein [Beggiatoa alba]EIJ42007.1 hypothetical protein BegalDRAFT_1104 [Beggiatoa alba B18LD]EIJ42979.1 hypothetical protein BegalDRAFT_2114 [Beggiatoa alba B18LD]
MLSVQHLHQRTSQWAKRLLAAVLPPAPPAPEITLPISSAEIIADHVQFETIKQAILSRHCLPIPQQLKLKYDLSYANAKNYLNQLVDLGFLIRDTNGRYLLNRDNPASQLGFNQLAQRLKQMN